MEDLTGRTIGRYAVTRLFRRFGVDALYLAHDPLLERHVLLKIGNVAEGRPLASRYLKNEARLLAMLDHPGVQRVFDAGEHEGRLWFVAEYFPGSSIAAFKEEGIPELGIFRRVFTQLAETMSYVHRRGIVHRNLNPGVVRFDSQGRPHVTAFSLAAERDDENALPALGTSAYMAPELVGATDFGGGPEVDIWSIGAQMFELLSGEHPLGRAMERRPIPPLGKRAPQVPAAICALVDRCLAEDPSARFHDAGELLAALEAATGDADTPSGERAFVSHSHRDREFVEQELIPALEQGGIPTWYAKKDIGGASLWERTVVHGLESCPWFLLVMSPRSAESEWVRYELHWALDHRRGRILPLLLEDVDAYRFHLAIPTLQHIDFRLERAAGRRELVRRLRA